LNAEKVKAEGHCKDNKDCWAKQYTLDECMEIVDGTRRRICEKETSQEKIYINPFGHKNTRSNLG